MKNLFFLLGLLLLCSFAPVDTPSAPLSAGLILAILTGIWEVIGRLIPSVGQITVIGKILEILTWISNFLNNKKK
jgi:hypothetical protein